LQRIFERGGGWFWDGCGLRSLEDVEKEVIAATLEAMRYKISQAADVLGISRKTLLEKRKKYGLK